VALNVVLCTGGRAGIVLVVDTQYHIMFDPYLSQVRYVELGVFLDPGGEVKDAAFGASLGLELRDYDIVIHVTVTPPGRLHAK
jgi:hypothetical protein